MGGQACILYGAAEFSRDADIAVLADAANLANLNLAVEDLQASVIAIPPFDVQYLDRGHAVHFRCGRVDVAGVRLDVMSVMRGVNPFPILWDRRSTLQLDSEEIEVLSLPDLVAAKKTQRDKDWPMIRRLVDINYFANAHSATDNQLAFWLKETRSPETLLKLIAEHPQQAAEAAKERNVVRLAMTGADEPALQLALYEEEQAVRSIDRAYWAPLRKELEQLRHAKH